MTTIIKYENISKKYGEYDALNNISLDIEEGDFLVIIGSSGSGKTTMLKMINGLIMPNEGNLLINGTNLNQMDLIKLRREIGYVIQGNILFPHMNVEDNISYVPRLTNASKEKIEEIIVKNMELVNLPLELRKRMPEELSGGQQQRVGIARGYAASSKILLMDEPFGSVDAITRYQLQRELKEIHKKTNNTVVFITHDINEALKLGTKVLVLDKGEIQQFGTPEEITSNPANDFVRQIIEMAK